MTLIRMKRQLFSLNVLFVNQEHKTMRTYVMCLAIWNNYVWSTDIFSKVTGQ